MICCVQNCCIICVVGSYSVRTARYIIIYQGLFRGAIGLYFVSMDDNARPNRSHAVEKLIESENIWPPCSRELNTIEHV